MDSVIEIKIEKQRSFTARSWTGNQLKVCLVHAGRAWIKTWFVNVTHTKQQADYWQSFQEKQH